VLSCSGGSIQETSFVFNHFHWGFRQGGKGVVDGPGAPIPVRVLASQSGAFASPTQGRVCQAAGRLGEALHRPLAKSRPCFLLDSLMITGYHLTRVPPCTIKDDDRWSDRHDSVRP